MTPPTLNKLQHAVLRALASVRGSNATALHQALADQFPSTRRPAISEALTQLEDMGLARAYDKNEWQTTNGGQAVALGIGPANTRREGGQPTSHELLAMATPSRPRTSMGTGDRRPPVLRPGSEVALQLPSRMGSELRYPGGRTEAA